MLLRATFKSGSAFTVSAVQVPRLLTCRKTCNWLAVPLVVQHPVQLIQNSSKCVEFWSENVRVEDCTDAGRWFCSRRSSLRAQCTMSRRSTWNCRCLSPAARQHGTCCSFPRSTDWVTHSRLRCPPRASATRPRRPELPPRHCSSSASRQRWPLPATSSTPQPSHAFSPARITSCCYYMFAAMSGQHWWVSTFLATLLCW